MALPCFMLDCALPVQLKTRAFDANGLGKLMVPVIDLANHRNHCPHTITANPNCGPKAPDGCMVWVAGENVPAGSEVCNGYVPFMPQDKAMLMYGMLQVRCFSFVAGKLVMQSSSHSHWHQ